MQWFENKNLIKILLCQCYVVEGVVICVTSVAPRDVMLFF